MSAHLPHFAFVQICELREKRLEQEDVYTDFQKGVELLKKENDTLIKKEKVIDKALRDTEADIQAFQTEKQRKLNELHVLVMLQLHQVCATSSPSPIRWSPPLID